MSHNDTSSSGEAKSFVRILRDLTFESCFSVDELSHMLEVSPQQIEAWLKGNGLVLLSHHHDESARAIHRALYDVKSGMTQKEKKREIIASFASDGRLNKKATTRSFLLPFVKIKENTSTLLFGGRK